MPKEIYDIKQKYGFGMTAQAYVIYKNLKDEQSKQHMIDWFIKNIPYTMGGGHALQYLKDNVNFFSNNEEVVFLDKNGNIIKDERTEGE